MDEEKPQANTPHSSAAPPAEVLTLSPADAAIVDALLENQAGVGAATVVGAAANPSQQQVRRLFELLSLAPAPATPPGLLARTLEAVRRQGQPPRDQWKLHAPPARQSWLNQRALELSAMAAAAVVLAAVLIPGIRSARENALRTACADNLRSIGRGLAQYSATNTGLLPAIRRPRDGDWLPRTASTPVLRSADAHSNTANLSPLVYRPRYVAFRRLECPGCDMLPSVKAGVSASTVGYSYINQFGKYDHRMTGRHSLVLLADRNPLFAAHAVPSGLANSPNHDGDGQNILSADGSVQWTTTPTVGPRGDDIWTIGSASRVQYTGTETPHSPNDIILSP